MSDVIGAAERAARQSDRVLFIASLIVMGIFAVFVARFFVAQYMRLIEDHRKDRDNFAASLQSIIEKQNSTAQSLAVSLERNTEAFRNCSEAIRFCQERASKKLC